MNNDYSVYYLHMLVTKIYDYEPSLFDKIKSQIFHKFKSGDITDIYDGVNLWINNKPNALQLYGHISLWDTSQITDMSHLFYDETEFNDDISSWIHPV